MFENLESPSEFDYELIKIIWRYMSQEQRALFEESVKNSISEWDLIAYKELTKTILFIKSA